MLLGVGSIGYLNTLEETNPLLLKENQRCQAVLEPWIGQDIDVWGKIKKITAMPTFKVNIPPEGKLGIKLKDGPEMGNVIKLYKILEDSVMEGKNQPGRSISVGVSSLSLIL